MFEWTDSRIDLLKKCVAQSMSASQAAAVIGGISRNGAIGKAQRLGLKFTSRYQPTKIARRTARGVVPFVPSAVRQAKRIEKMVRTGSRSFAMRAQDIIVEPVQPIPATAVSIPATAVSIPATAVSIFELTARTCRWPLWGPDTPAAHKLYCGGERIKPAVGSWDKMNACPPYCAYHCAVAYGRSEP
jgi:hypothetical protein